jgi:hypothetical protein
MDRNGQPSLYERVRAIVEASASPDVMVMAEQVIEVCDDSERRYFMLRGASEMVRAALADLRRPRRRLIDTIPAGERAAINGRELDPSLFRVYANGEERWLPDCDAEFLRAAAGECERQAQTLMDTAGRLLRLADAMDEAGVELAKDLPRELVVEILTASAEAVGA